MAERPCGGGEGESEVEVWLEEEGETGVLAAPVALVADRSGPVCSTCVDTEDLLWDRRYMYRAAPTQPWAAFRTGSGKEGPVCLGFLGDVGPTSLGSLESWGVLLDRETGSQAGRIEGLLVAGDVSYHRDSGDAVARGSTPTMDAYADLISAVSPYLPTIAVLGNHDRAHPRQVFDEWSMRFAPHYMMGGEGTAAAACDAVFERGPFCVATLCVDGDAQPLDETRQRWLRRAFRACDAPHRILMLHRPVINDGINYGENPELRDTLLPLLRSAGVVLVVTGHEHVLQVDRVDDIVFVTAAAERAHVARPRHVGPWRSERAPASTIFRSVDEFGYGRICATTDEVTELSLLTDRQVIDILEKK